VDRMVLKDTMVTLIMEVKHSRLVTGLFEEDYDLPVVEDYDRKKFEKY